MTMARRFMRSELRPDAFNSKIYRTDSENPNGLETRNVTLNSPLLVEAWHNASTDTQKNGFNKCEDDWGSLVGMYDPCIVHRD